MKRRVSSVKSRPLEVWTLPDLCAWLHVGVGLPAYIPAVESLLRRVAAAGSTEPPGVYLASMSERALAAEVTMIPCSALSLWLVWCGSLCDMC
jgi:hypothetical protein